MQDFQNLIQHLCFKNSSINLDFKIKLIHLHKSQNETIWSNIGLTPLIYGISNQKTYFDTHGLKCIVRVHEAMYQIVHGHEPTTGRCEVFVAIPAVDKHGGVVIPVQEDELLLSQNNKHGVDELWQFAQDKHQGPEAGDAICIAIIANTMDNSVLGQSPNEIGPDTNSANDAKHGKHDVPDDEEAPQLEFGTILHEFPASEDEKHVDE